MKLDLAINCIKLKYPSISSDIEQRIADTLKTIDQKSGFLDLFNTEDLYVLYEIEVRNPDYFPGLSKAAAETMLALHKANPALPASLLLEITTDCSCRARPWESLKAFARIAYFDPKQINREALVCLKNMHSDILSINSFDIQKKSQAQTSFFKPIDNVNAAAKIDLVKMKPIHYKKIPNKIHFIWLGGALPDKYKYKIIKLADVAQRSGFEITLWTDDPTKQKKSIEGNIHYITSTTSAHATKSLMFANLKIRHINELIPVMEKDFLYKDSELIKKFSYCVNRELVGFKNYAAASDLLRYEILRQEGGYYFDTDIHFKLTRGCKLVADDTYFGIKANILLRCSPSLGDDFKVTVCGYGGNSDIIAALPGHSVLINTIRMSIANYLKLDTSPAPVEYNKKKNRTLPEGRTKMDLKRSPFGSESPIYPDRLSTTSSRAILSVEAAGPAVFLNALKPLWEAKDNTFETLSSLGNVTHRNDDQRNSLTIAGISVTSYCDQTWLKKEKKYSSFDDTETQNARFTLNPL